MINKIDVVCERCGHKLPLATPNKKITEGKIISGKFKCPRCKHGKLKIVSSTKE